MTDTKNHGVDNVAGSLEGRVFRPASFAELAEAVELAFDYRGDVTITLKSGESLVGYLFNRQVSGSEFSLELFPSDNFLQISYQTGSVGYLHNGVSK